MLSSALVATLSRAVSGFELTDGVLYRVHWFNVTPLEKSGKRVGDIEFAWSFVAPYLTLMTEEASQREHGLREVFHGLRWIVRTGAPCA